MLYGRTAKRSDDIFVLIFFSTTPARRIPLDGILLDSCHGSIHAFFVFLSSWTTYFGLRGEFEGNIKSCAHVLGRWTCLLETIFWWVWSWERVNGDFMINGTD